MGGKVILEQFWLLAITLPLTNPFTNLDIFRLFTHRLIRHINWLFCVKIGISCKKSVDYELSDTEVSEELPIDNEVINGLSQNDIVLDFTTSSSSLPLESPTICADIISDFDEENRITRRECELRMSGRRISPIGCEDHLQDDNTLIVSDDSDLDTRATYNVYSPGRPQIVRPVVRKVYLF